jgi:hypothetical protein
MKKALKESHRQKGAFFRKRVTDRNVMYKDKRKRMADRNVMYKDKRKRMTDRNVMYKDRKNGILERKSNNSNYEDEGDKRIEGP